MKEVNQLIDRLQKTEKKIRDAKAAADSTLQLELEFLEEDVKEGRRKVEKYRDAIAAQST